MANLAPNLHSNATGKNKAHIFEGLILHIRLTNFHLVKTISWINGITCITPKLEMSLSTKVT